MENNPKKSKAIIITIIAIVVLLIVGYLLFSNREALGIKPTSTIGKIFSPLSTSNNPKELTPIEGTNAVPGEIPTNNDTSGSNKSLWGSLSGFFGDLFNGSGQPSSLPDNVMIDKNSGILTFPDSSTFDPKTKVFTPFGNGQFDSNTGIWTLSDGSTFNPNTGVFSPGNGSNNNTCPSGWTGVYPICTAPTSCPTGWTGTYPLCTSTTGSTGNCPANWTGTYPICKAPTDCPTGWTGTYPVCTATQGGGTTNPPISGSDLIVGMVTPSLKPVLPTVITSAPLSITKTSAVIGGLITFNGGSSITSSGTVWGTTTLPTTSLFTKKVNGVFYSGSNIPWSNSITGLTPNTTYYVRAYATNSIGTEYGPEISFKTLAGTTILTQNDAAAPVEGGCTGTPWGNVPNGYSGTAFSSSSTSSSNTCVSEIRTCTNGTMSGTYTATSCFRSAPTSPIVNSPTKSTIGPISATVGANIASNGGRTITARGICYGTTPSPTTNCAGKGTAIGIFTRDLTDLTPSTLYYYRGYATNSIGTGYSADETITTPAITVSVTATASYSTQPSTAISFNYASTTNVGTATCRLLDNASSPLTSYSATNPIPYTSASASGSYAYYVQCQNSINTAIVATSNQIIVTVTSPVSSITFDSAGGSAVPTITQEVGTAISAPANPTRAGYTFTRWSPALASLMPSGGQTLTAVWGANCSSPCGTISDGNTCTAYASENPNGSCVSEVRTCTNGTLSGSNTAVSCLAGCSSPCGQITSGSTCTAYSESSVVSPASCTSEVRTCTNGTLSGSFANSACTVVSGGGGGTGGGGSNFTVSIYNNTSATTSTTGGTISGTSVAVQSGTYGYFSATPNAGYYVHSDTTCSGATVTKLTYPPNKYSVGPVSSNCSVNITFNQTP